MAKITGRQLGLELCEVLKIDPTNVRSIKIVCDVNAVAEVDIERYLEGPEINGCKKILEHYDVVIRDTVNI